MQLKIRNPKARGIFGEIMARLDMIEVRGDSVEHLFLVKTGMKQILESVEEIPDEEKEKEVKEG